MNTPTKTEMQKAFAEFCGLDIYKDQLGHLHFLVPNTPQFANNEIDPIGSIDALQGVIERMSEEQKGDLHSRLKFNWIKGSKTITFFWYVITLKPAQLAPLVYAVIKPSTERPT